MLKRVKQGVNFNDADLGLDVIKEVGPGGSFLVHPHSVKRMKTEALLPKIADRNTRDNWEKKGSLDTHTRAMQRAKVILTKPSSAVFSSDLDDRIHSAFPGLVPGKLELPSGWK